MNYEINEFWHEGTLVVVLCLQGEYEGWVYRSVWVDSSGRLLVGQSFWLKSKILPKEDIINDVINYVWVREISFFIDMENADKEEMLCNNIKWASSAFLTLDPAQQLVMCKDIIKRLTKPHELDEYYVEE